VYANTVFAPPFYTNNHLFTKTGPGQIWGKLKKGPFSQADARGIYWHSSLLDPLGFPTPEMTGTASFVYGLAFGASENRLPPP
jgi:hypothetical protein